MPTSPITPPPGESKASGPAPLKEEGRRVGGAANPWVGRPHDGALCLEEG
jgi:hypothetical protein